ncbi:MAG: glycosyltransferase [Nitrospirales bacterium]|nr:glycosyltransferase [Nitrospirales bacterium]
MNILILAVGSYGDVLPLVGLGRELRTHGHTITLFTNGHFASLMEQAQLHFVPLGSAEDYDDIADNPDLWHPHKGWRLIMQRLASPQLREAYRVLCRHIRQGDTIMVSSTLGFSARLVQETHSIPHATVHFSPGVFHSAHAPPKMPNLVLPDWLPIWFKRGCWSLINHTVIDPVLKPYLNTFRRELGLPPVSRIFHSWAHSPDLVVGMFPDWFAPVQRDWPSGTHLTGFPLYDEAHDAELTASVELFLEAHSQPLVYTPGSANKHGRSFFREAAEASQQLGRPAIFLTRYPEQLPPSLPKSIRHFAYVPLSRLLPHCTALIHHGGIGTCSQAMRAGIPQLIQPLAFDQFDNAARTVTLGVGKMILSRAFRSPLIARTLEGMLANPDTHQRCQHLAQRVRETNGLSLACQIIQKQLINRIF